MRNLRTLIKKLKMPFISKDTSTHKNIIVLGESGHIKSEGDDLLVMESETITDTNILNQQEILLLLELVRKSTFSGAQVELVYNTAVKLQNQFLDLNIQPQ